MMRFYEDIHVGDRVELGSHLFAAPDIKMFAQQFDPQSFHLDEAEASRSHVGALIASGWHVATIWVRKLVDHHRREAEAMRARGERVPVVGPSPGFRDLRWLKPVFAGDTISYGFEVIDRRVSQSRPDRGIVRLLARGQNQQGVRVISFESVTFVERRAATPP